MEETPRHRPSSQQKAPSNLNNRNQTNILPTPYNGLKPSTIIPQPLPPSIISDQMSWQHTKGTSLQKQLFMVSGPHMNMIEQFDTKLKKTEHKRWSQYNHSLKHNSYTVGDFYKSPPLPPHSNNKTYALHTISNRDVDLVTAANRNTAVTHVEQQATMSNNAGIQKQLTADSDKPNKHQHHTNDQQIRIAQGKKELTNLIKNQSGLAGYTENLSSSPNIRHKKFNYQGLITQNTDNMNRSAEDDVININNNRDKEAHNANYNIKGIQSTSREYNTSSKPKFSAYITEMGRARNWSAESTLSSDPPPVLMLTTQEIEIMEKLDKKIFSVSTPINIEKLICLTKHHPNRAFVNYIIQGLREGFRYNYRKQRDENIFQQNLPSIEVNPVAFQVSVQKELELGRIAGPFDQASINIIQNKPMWFGS